MGGQNLGTALARAAVIAALLALSGCGAALLDPAGPVGMGERRLLLQAFFAMLIIIVPVIVLTIGFAFWYRAGNSRATYAPEWTYSGRVELITWAVSLMMIMFLGALAWENSHTLDPYRPLASRARPLRVDVVAMDWKWLFLYPSLGVASVNQLALPVGVPVEFHLTSASVMNSFMVPKLGGQIYAMSGMETRLSLQADHPGRFPGLATNISGDGFADMHFDALAMRGPEFAAWLARARASTTSMDSARYRALVSPSEAVHPALFAPLEAGLFQRILLREAALLPRTPGVDQNGVPLDRSARGPQPHGILNAAG